MQLLDEILGDFPAELIRQSSFSNFQGHGAQTKRAFPIRRHDLSAKNADLLNALCYYFFSRAHSATLNALCFMRAYSAQRVLSVICVEFEKRAHSAALNAL